MTKKFHYGGQAVIEGVMMRGRSSMVTAVRKPGGAIVTDVQPLGSLYTGRLRRTPLIRGVIALIEAIALGIKPLLYSANVSLEEEGEKISGAMVWALVGVSLIIGVALFFVAPLFLTRLLNQYISSSIVFNLIEGLIRVVIFLLYLFLVGLIPSIKEVFAYHGAEHKTINAYEAGAPLEPGAAKPFSTAHRRCSTSFLFVVLVIAILVFALLGKQNLWLMIVGRIILVPFIAALGYEVIFFSANHPDSRLVRALVAPGLWLQAMTTRPPDDRQLEVAVVALRAAVEADQPQPQPAV